MPWKDLKRTEWRHRDSMEIAMSRLGYLGEDILVSKDKALWSKIKFVLDNLAVPLTLHSGTMMELANKHANDPSFPQASFHPQLLSGMIS